MRYLIHVLLGTGIVLLIAGCGGRDTVASKSAAAFREAEATGKTVRGGHHHGSAPAVQTSTAMAADHSMHQHGTDAAAPGHATHSTGRTDHSSMTHAGSRAPSHHGATPTHTEHGAAHAGAVPSHAQHAASSATQSAGHADHRGEPLRPTPAAADHSGHVSPTAPPQHHGLAMPGETRASPPGRAMPGTAPVLPVTSKAIEAAQPSATLRQDPFDAPVAVSVSEAKKAGEGSHGGHGAASPAPATAAPHQHAADADSRVAGPETTVYSCPMHPEVTSDKPGACPKCGMTLVKRKNP